MRCTGSCHAAPCRISFMKCCMHECQDPLLSQSLS
jgi:hypothetical protein